MAKTLVKIVSVFVIMVIILYICSIFTVNLCGRVFVNYDIYSDMILAKYMALEKNLFPKGWHFGNQIYTVATPVVASVFYLLVGESYLSLALASCSMTILCVLSFLWCVKPFSGSRSIIPALLVLIGGTNIGISAHGDIEGLQVFYTMASYYSCYVIGIFVTLGAYFRYLNGRSVSVFAFLGILALNFALGMQSLREMLVLNLPLCAIALLEIIFIRKDQKNKNRSDSRPFKFAGAALLANIGGVLLNKLLVSGGIIAQHEILKETESRLGDAVIRSINAFGEYIGFVAPTTIFTAFKLLGACFSVVIVTVSLVFAVVDLIKHKKTVLGNCILFFLVSLTAVFCAGILFINLRPIYYFCWYLLVSFCVAYLMEIEWTQHKSLLGCLKGLLMIGLICVSLMNYKYTFKLSFRDLHNANNYYQDIIEQLNADGIRYLYSDWRVQQNVISAMSKDEIVYGTMSFSGVPEDLWDTVEHLYMDSWFDAENFEDAYIVMNSGSLQTLEEDFSPEYQKVFMSNLELVHEFAGEDSTVYFFKGTEKMFNDMIE